MNENERHENADAEPRQTDTPDEALPTNVDSEGSVDSASSAENDAVTKSNAAANSGANSTTESGLEFDSETVRRYLQWGALFALFALAVVAGAGLYTSLGSLIDVWVADRYQPIARGAVNLAVLCAAIGGMVVLLRRR